ncbi:MAG: SHOCT domain-containing protein [Actinobacteria bacterium]|nr:SHOCT domain-containing protein [Actinomycetota bacterium]
MRPPRGRPFRIAASRSTTNSYGKETVLPLADISFGELLLVVFEVFLFVIWIWILFTIIADLFRDHELSGWWKAVWILFLVFIPFLTALIYLIVRGNGMRDRTIKAQADAKEHFDAYVREQAHTASPADELHKLNDLKEKGALSDAEFEQAKAKLLA